MVTEGQAEEPDRWLFLCFNKRGSIVCNLFPLRQHGTTDLKVSPLTQAFSIFLSKMKVLLFNREIGIYAGLDTASYLHLLFLLWPLFPVCCLCSSLNVHLLVFVLGEALPVCFSCCASY